MSKMPLAALSTATSVPFLTIEITSASGGAVVAGGVVAVAAVDVELDRAGDADGHRGDVGAAERGGDEVVQRRLAAGDAGLGAEAVDDRASVRARERDLVRLVATAGDDRVGRAVTAACRSRRG